MFGKNKNRAKGNKLFGRPSTTTPGDPAVMEQYQQQRANPPPAPQPPGLPVPVGEMLPWLLISAASYAAFLYLPGRVQSPRARVTLIGGNEFINVASHLHFCFWIWVVQDLVFRILAILLFPPKRAAMYFLSMFVVPSSSSSSSSLETVGEIIAAEAVAASSEIGSPVVLQEITPSSSESQGNNGNNNNQYFIFNLLTSIFRPIRSLLVSPAPGQLDYVPQDYKPNDFRTHGGVEPGSTYWHYRHVAVLSFVVMFFIWLLLTYLYHTRHVFKQMKEKAEAKKKGAEDRKKESAKAKRAFRAEVEKKRDQILKARAEGKSVAKEDIEMVEKMMEQLESGEKNLAEDEFSDEDVDYDPYGRPVPDPPFFPTVSWMVLWSMVFGGCFVWVHALPTLISQVFPIGVCGTLAFCVLMPQ